MSVTKSYTVAGVLSRLAKLERARKAIDAEEARLRNLVVVNDRQPTATKPSKPRKRPPLRYQSATPEIEARRQIVLQAIRDGADSCQAVVAATEVVTATAWNDLMWLLKRGRVVRVEKRFSVPQPPLDHGGNS
jgi:hypothetical protein